MQLVVVKSMKSYIRLLYNSLRPSGFYIGRLGAAGQPPANLIMVPV